VLDLRRTFLEPELPWARQSFNATGYRSLEERGYLLLDDAFRIGWVLVEEMRRYSPLTGFVSSVLPALIVQGDPDTYVSYDIAREAAASRPACDLVTIEGSDHGFDGVENERRAREATVGWMAARFC